MTVASSLNKPFIWYIFRDNGLEVEVKYKDGKISKVSGQLYDNEKELFIKTVENENKRLTYRDTRDCI